MVHLFKINIYHHIAQQMSIYVWLNGVKYTYKKYVYVCEWLS